MIATTTLEKNFARIRAEQGYSLAERAYLHSVNIANDLPGGIVAEMADVASYSSAIKLPLWHTLLAWAPGEEVTQEQKIEAAELYCELIGASLDKHQLAVFEDKTHAHCCVHVYLNRVPMGKGPALRSDFNYARNRSATAQICAQLGFVPLPEKGKSIRDCICQTKKLVVITVGIDVSLPSKFLFINLFAYR